MSVRLSVATGSLLLATATTAVGLNLAVIDLGRTEAGDDSSATGSPDEVVDSGAPTEAAASSFQAPTPVALTGARVLAVAVGQPEGAVAGKPAVQGAATDAEASARSTGPTPPTDRAPTTAAAQVPSTPASSSAPLSSTAPATTARPTTSTSTAPPSTTATSTVAPTEYLTYEFEGIATIVVARHAGDRLEFWSATSEDGWAYKVEDRGPEKIKIKFRPIKGGDEAEFELEVEDGRLKVKREY